MEGGFETPPSSPRARVIRHRESDEVTAFRLALGKLNPAELRRVVDKLDSEEHSLLSKLAALGVSEPKDGDGSSSSDDGESSVVLMVDGRQIKRRKAYDIIEAHFEGDVIVRECCEILKPNPLDPSMPMSRQELYGLMLLAGGPCALTDGGWRPDYVHDIVQFVDPTDPTLDRTILFGLYDGAVTPMEQAWHPDDITADAQLRVLKGRWPDMTVSSWLECGQPLFRVLEAPDANAVAMLEVSPSLFISGASMIRGVEKDNGKHDRHFHVPAVWRLRKSSRSTVWFKKHNHMRLVTNDVPSKNTKGEYAWYLLHLRNDDGTPILPRVVTIMGRNSICFVPILCFLIRHGWAPARNHSRLDRVTNTWSLASWFCSWTPHNGYSTTKNTTKTTKVRLFAGAEPLVIAEAKLYTPGAHMHPVEMYQSSAMEAEDGALYKNKWNRIMQYRASDSKWFCTHCNQFCWLMKDVQKTHGQILMTHRCWGTRY